MASQRGHPYIGRRMNDFIATCLFTLHSSLFTGNVATSLMPDCDLVAAGDDELVLVELQLTGLEVVE